MKTNCSRISVVVVCVQLLLLTFSLTSQAAPDFNFSSGSLISGTDKQAGAKYRFVNVKPGIDAIVTINSFTGGVTLVSVDGGSGFNEAFQPALNIPAKSNGYAEFTISFVLTGTTVPAIMTQVPITPIDVDGNRSGSKYVYEYDMIKWNANSYVDYDMQGGELNVTYNSTWVTGTNISGVDYPGIDTVAREVMFSVVVPNISSIVIRTGADNQTNSSQERLRSIYFKRFTYPNSHLPVSALLSFNGTEKNNTVSLQWKLSSGHDLRQISIERANSSGNYQTIGTTWIGQDAASSNMFNFTDPAAISGKVYYRLKMVTVNGSTTYSNVLLFTAEANAVQRLNMYPSVIQSATTVQIQATDKGQGVFQLIDYTGRVVMQQTLYVQQGNNSIVVNNVSSVQAGNYIAVLKLNEQVYSEKVMKQ